MGDFSPYIFDPDLERVIEAEFFVEDRYIEFDTPTFIVSPREGVYSPEVVKDSFKRVARAFREKGFLPFLRREGGRLVIRVVKKRPSGRPSYRLNLLLLLITIGTISLDGYLKSNIRIFTEDLMANTPVLVNTLLFLVSVLGIFGLHELAHKFVSMKENIEASMPYFIPAPPGLGGTYGAVIIQREPPTNRDELFDLGLSGPLIGFLATVIVSIFGISLSFTVPYSKLQEWSRRYPEVAFQPLPMPPLINLLIPLIKPIPPGQTLILHPVAFAAWVGCLIAFLNLLPIWQLDGGHISRALLGAKRHRVVSLVGLLVMVLCGFYMMAILLAFFMLRAKQDIGPLDDVSPLSLGRKILLLVYVAVLALTVTVIRPILF
ncbi:hypothetical protein DRO56_05235 [Candidatus Bathyarchaeota archaeon]|nr:MAG: hypothetical protein DRO56_05235 [Candidatus Bathyarchaeota archaeon]